MNETTDIDLTRLPQPFLENHPEWVDLYHFAWRLAAGHIRESRGRRHLDAAWDPTRNFQWVWDTCFMALYCRYGADQYPGVQSLDNFYELQRRDGYIGMTYDMTTGQEPWPGYINPPLFAWVEWEHYRTTGDAARFRRVTSHIERLMRWIDANHRTAPHRRRAGHGKLRKDEYQLYYFRDCGSSGMDDAPRTPRLPEAGRFFDWIDLSSQMALSFDRLAKMHAALGNRARARHWQQRARDVGELINTELWCEATGFYHDRMLPDNFVAAKTAAGFWPLVAGICPAARRDILVAHLENEREFRRPTPVPSLSADDPNYCANGTYWRGGVWAPTNYMITRGLMLAGRGDAAHAIAVRYLGALARTRAKARPHTLWECYAPEADRPGRAAYSGKRVKPHFVGWTGIGPIAMLLENVIGLDVNAADRSVTWDIRLTEDHGVRQMPVGDGRQADFRCRPRRSANAPARVEVRSDRDLRLVIRRGGRTVRGQVAAGNRWTGTV